MPLPSFRDVVLEHYPPHAHWPEQQRSRVRLWPVLLLGCAALLCAIAVVVLSNYDARSCDEAVRFEHWTEERRSAGCKMYYTLSDNGHWISAIVEDYDALPHVTLLSAVAAQSPGQPAFQPTTLTPASAYHLRSMHFAAFTFRPVSSGLILDILLTAAYDDFSLDCHFIGHVLPADALQLGSEAGEVLLRASVSNSSSGQLHWNTTLAGSTYNSSTTELVLQLFWSPLPNALVVGLQSSVDDFLTAQHIMHCVACIKQSAVSICWIILLGCFQAAAIVSTLVGYCIRHCNKHLQPSADTLPERSWIQSDEQTDAIERGLVNGGLEEQLL